MLTLDHIAVAAESLDAGRAYVEAALGVRMQPGGQHARYGTHNLLLGLEEGLYLEVIAVDPAAPALGHARWFDLDRFSGPPRIGNWICRTQGLSEFVGREPQAGVPQRLTRDDLVWHMAVPQDGILPYDDCFPAVMDWGGTAHPATRLTPSGCRLRELTLRHPDPEALAQMIAPHLDDARIVVEHGTAGLEAEFETPSGICRL